MRGALAAGLALQAPCRSALAAEEVHICHNAESFISITRNVHSLALWECDPSLGYCFTQRCVAVQVLQVGGGAAFTSISQALAAAPEGATIRVAPGMCVAGSRVWPPTLVSPPKATKKRHVLRPYVRHGYHTQVCGAPGD